MPGESAEHRQLVTDLGLLLRDSGYIVTGLDIPGHRRPVPLRSRRPDVTAGHLRWGLRLVGEVKLGPELLADRSIEQVRMLTRTTEPCRRPRYATFLLAVPARYVNDAWRAIALAGAAQHSPIVVGRTNRGWILTWLPEANASTWRARNILPIPASPVRSGEYSSGRSSHYLSAHDREGAWAGRRDRAHGRATRGSLPLR